MTPLLDITKDVCPMTFVKVKMGLAKIGAGDALEVLLAEEALKNVISSLKQEGHRVTSVSRQDGGFVIRVEKDGGRA